MLNDQQRETVIAALEYKKGSIMYLPHSLEPDEANQMIDDLNDALAAANAMAAYERVPNGEYVFSGCIDPDEDCDCHSIWLVTDDSLTITDTVGDIVSDDWPAGWALVRTREGVSHE